MFTPASGLHGYKKKKSVCGSLSLTPSVGTSTQKSAYRAHSLHKYSKNITPSTGKSEKVCTSSLHPWVQCSTKKCVRAHSLHGYNNNKKVCDSLPPRVQQQKSVYELTPSTSTKKNVTPFTCTKEKKNAKAKYMRKPICRAFIRVYSR